MVLSNLNLLLPTWSLSLTLLPLQFVHRVKLTPSTLILAMLSTFLSVHCYIMNSVITGYLPVI
jgi:hypothetical protein